MPVLVDPKNRSFGRYRGATLICPNRKELAVATGEPTEGLQPLLAAGQAMLPSLQMQLMAVTLGEEGIAVLRPDSCRRAPAVVRQVYDVSGAGDTVIAVLALALACGVEIETAAHIANIAAGIVVSKVGTVPVQREELLSALAREAAPSTGEKVLPLDRLRSRVATWRSAGQRVVFTNGCFDILHIGHILLLEQARRAGDRLIVGLNSDNSIRRIKGPPRPIIGQDERAQILAALSAVDAVVLFDESTPLKLIEAIRPDVLVKGGDYTEDNIAGAREVRAWGGRVEIIPLVEGVSTTRLLAKAAATVPAPAIGARDSELNPMLPPLLFSVRLPTLLAKAWRALLPHQSSSGPPRRGRLRIITFRLDAMGDVVMTTPFFRELKRNFPNSYCTAVVQHDFRPLLVTNPFLDEILTLPEITAVWLPRRAKNLLAALRFYWRSLRTRSFDIAISPRWDVDEHLATLAVPAHQRHQRVGYTEKTSPRKQQFNRGFDAAFSLRLPAGPVRHEVRRNLAVVEALGGAVHDSRLEVRLTEHDREFAARLLANVAASTKMIALGIGANSAGRRWPLVRYAEAVSRLARKFQVQPIILCSAGERDQALTLAGVLNRKAIILAGAPLREACAVLERCDLFIGNDSGTAHLAAAMDCKTIVISRHPRDGDPDHSNSPLRFGPYCRDTRVLQPATGLDACTSSCRVTEPHCITAVPVDEVVSAAQAILGGHLVRAERGERTVLTTCQHSQTHTICHHEWAPAREGSAFPRNIKLSGISK